MIISYYCCLLSLLLLRLCLACRLVVEGTELASSSVFGCCFAAVLQQWVPGHVRQHMIMVFCDFAGTPERRGRRPWLICSSRAFVRCFELAKVSYPIKGGNLAIFFCCLQVVCVVALAPWGAIA